jgi:hypothetical protein
VGSNNIEDDGSKGSQALLEAQGDEKLLYFCIVINTLNQLD